MARVAEANCAVHDDLTIQRLGKLIEFARVFGGDIKGRLLELYRFYACNDFGAISINQRFAEPFWQTWNPEDFPFLWSLISDFAHDGIHQAFEMRIAFISGA